MVHKTGFEYYETRNDDELLLFTHSAMEKTSRYRSFQKDSSRKILDSRTALDEDFPPLELLYSAFGKFLDRVKKGPEGITNKSRMAKVKPLVDEFAKHIGDSFPAEDEMSQKSENILFDILGMALDSTYESFEALNMKVRTGRHLLGPKGVPMVIVEHKNELAGAEPQLASYFRRLVNDANPDIFLGWQLPALGILIKGK